MTSEPITLVVSTRAVYSFPPLIVADETKFLVLSSVERLPLANVILCSLPFRMRVNGCLFFPFSCFTFDSDTLRRYDRWR